MLRYPQEHLYVYPKHLTAKGREVEKVLAKYQKEVNPPYFTTGYVDGSPSLKIAAPEPKEDIIFQHPYKNAEELYLIAAQSQVGTAEKTLYRLDARKSREFSNVEVLDEAWKEKVVSICGQIREVLAPGATKVNAELYKLLIYREGDFFDCHQDAQYSARMFATLLFFLSVEYTGGEFIMNEPQKHTVEDKKNPGGCSWVAFYTDVCHRVNKVMGGFRVALNYCLSFEGAMSPSRFLPSMDQSAVGIICDYFKTYDKKGLAIPLRYKYTQATLSPDFLKGVDAFTFNAFNAVGEFADPKLHFVLRFDKTKVIQELGDLDNERIFQGIFLVDCEIVKKYFKIKTDYEEQKAEVEGDQWSNLWEKCENEYSVLMEEVKASQEGFDLEWLVKRESRQFYAGENLFFGVGHGQLGWLGNMTPAKEYYYLQAAIVVVAREESYSPEIRLSPSSKRIKLH